jgi:hypothetical protein
VGLPPAPDDSFFEEHDAIIVKRPAHKNNIADVLKTIIANLRFNLMDELTPGIVNATEAPEE